MLSASFDGFDLMFDVHLFPNQFEFNLYLLL